MATLDNFQSRMNILANRMERNITRLVQNVANVTAQNVIIGTPVDTGKAKSNWLAAIGQAASSIVQPHVPGAKGSSASGNSAVAIGDAAVVIARYRAPGSIHITNNLDYIDDLNKGKSPQGAFFVERAVALGAQLVRNFTGLFS